MTEIEHLLELAEGNSLELAHLVAYSKANNISVVAVSEFLSYQVAKNYAAGVLHYVQCDRIMNSLFAVVTTKSFWKFSDQDVPPLVMSVFRAFDEGEYVHPGDPPEVDPEEKYTRPRIQALLTQLTTTPLFHRAAAGRP